MSGAGIAALGLLCKAWIRRYNEMSDEEKKAARQNINDDYDHHHFI